MLKLGLPGSKTSKQNQTTPPKASEQASKPASRQGSKQARKQAGKQASKQAGRQKQSPHLDHEVVLAHHLPGSGVEEEEGAALKPAGPGGGGGGLRQCGWVGIVMGVGSKRKKEPRSNLQGRVGVGVGLG